MMKFEIFYGILKLPEGAEVIYRKSVKAVVKKGRKILLIHTNKGDYKFPGGGYEDGEDLRECLSREMLEETGYRLTQVGDLLGNVLEQNSDKFESRKYFSMKSEYYNVEINESIQKKQNLDQYEKEQNFIPVFVEIEEAIQNNQNILKDTDREQNPWVKRETDVLNYLEQIE